MFLYSDKYVKDLFYKNKLPLKLYFLSTGDS